MKPADALLAVHYDGGEKQYEMQQTIQPGDQMWVNFAELIHSRLPDRKGNVLPADLTYGTDDVKDLGSGHGSLSVGAVALDEEWGHQAVVQSPDCCGFGAPLIDPSSVDLSVGGVETVGVDALDQCTNEEESIFTDITAWWSGNSAIATVTKGKVTGVTAGTTTANGSGEVLECFGNTEYFQQVAPSAPVTVQVPTSLKVISYPILSLTSVGCLATDYGMAIAITYQVLDQNGSPIQSSNMEPQEKILNQVFNDSDPISPYPNWVDIYNPNWPGSTQYTTSAGQFLDAPFATCATEAFTETSTQPISMLMNGTNYTVRTNNWKTVTTVPRGHGTMSNGSDINASN